MSTAFSGSVISTFSLVAADDAPCALAQGAQLVVQGFQIDRLGVEQPLQEKAVEGGDGDDGQAPALGIVGHHAAQPRLVHLADPAIELLETCPQLRPSLDALEDQVEHHAAELGILAQRLGEEAPARLGALLEAGESEYLLHRSAR